ncbi:MAG: MraY family glycosyltransferase, partial [Eubacteriales bacterium]
GGISCIAALTLAGVVWIDIRAHGGTPGQWDALILALILAAAALGFLRYNFYPARIFLGDSGSMFLGFSLAALSVMGMAKSATFISIFVPIVILGIPILDTFFAIVRRYADHRPIFSPDREHLHHRLVELGLSHRQAVLCIYVVSIVLGLSAVLLTILTPKEAVFLLVVLSTVAYIGANRIGVTGSRSRPGKGRAAFLMPRNDQRSHRM